MRLLLDEIEQKKEVPIQEFYSYVAIMYGIRKPTVEEYLEAWFDSGYIRIEKGIIKFIKKPDYQ